MVDFVHIYISPAKSKKSRKIKKSTPPLAFNGLLCIGEQNIIYLFCEILYSHFYPCSSLELYITFLFLYKSQTSNNKHQIQLENRKPNTENKDNKTETSRNWILPSNWKKKKDKEQPLTFIFVSSFVCLFVCLVFLFFLVDIFSFICPKATLCLIQRAFIKILGYEVALNNDPGSLQTFL